MFIVHMNIITTHKFPPIDVAGMSNPISVPYPVQSVFQMRHHTLQTISASHDMLLDRWIQSAGCVGKASATVLQRATYLAILRRAELNPGYGRVRQCAANTPVYP